MTEAQVGLGKFGCGGQIGIQHAARAERGALFFELSKRGFWPTQAELKVTQRGERPHLDPSEAHFAS
ncbi:MAG: hypothetical protein ACRDOL_38405 [Streptosporangiaceae bacterium]